MGSTAMRVDKAGADNRLLADMGQTMHAFRYLMGALLNVGRSQEQKAMGIVGFS